MNKKNIPYYKVVRCEDCEHYIMDEEGDYYCDVNLDEDEEEKMRTQGTKTCPYFKFYDEYKSVQKQI
ncbi:MAG: DUF6472 family protein [Clostridia bacterium]|nr:DUF6472 family protein [Clostridia bacterium]